MTDDADKVDATVAKERMQQRLLVFVVKGTEHQSARVASCAVADVTRVTHPLVVAVAPEAALRGEVMAVEVNHRDAGAVAALDALVHLFLCWQ